MEKVFTDEEVQEVWEKGLVVQDVNPNEWRRDKCGAWMKRVEYGNRNSNRGWEIDHIKPSSSGGSDNLVNLQPLHWQNNDSKGDGDLVCVVED